MKKSILKYIREEAAKLPVKIIQQRQTHRFTKEEVIEAAKKYGAPIPKLNKSSYPSTTNHLVEVNHEQKMKDLYKSGGLISVNKYISSFKKEDGAVSTAEAKE